MPTKRLTQDNTALVIVDVQGNLARAMWQTDALVTQLQKMIEGALAMALPIVWMEQLPDKLGPTIPELATLLADLDPLAKSSFSCGGDETFRARLKETGCTQVLLVGIESHVCVYQTALDLLDEGYEVSVVEDCISSRTEANRRLGLKRMVSAGAMPTSVEMALFELQRIAEGDQFKKLIKIVK